MLAYIKARAMGKKICEPGTILPISFGCCLNSIYYARSQGTEANFQSHPDFLTLDLSVPNMKTFPIKTFPP